MSELQYKVRSISLLNYINEVRSKTYIMDAYFQRNLVWRDVHKRDFIETILLGYPFPQIFISKGKIDVEKMATISCIVDGQQRTNAILQYIKGDFPVKDRYFKDLNSDEKNAFLKYEIALIELDLENDDPKVKEIFQRINRTSNSLTTIEKLASAYSTSEFLLVARLLCGTIDLNRKKDNEQNGSLDFKEDPNIPETFYVWARAKKLKSFPRLINTKKIYTPMDITRKVHLMHILNIMSTYLFSFFNRNEKSISVLDELAYDFPKKDELVDKLEITANLILKMKLDNFWFKKANIFSLIIALSLADQQNINIKSLASKLNSFAFSPPEDYKLAATEAVNNRRERLLRHQHINDIIERSI
ncbi:Protein of unknown function DUF262 [Snodgrassella alvi SCGC AB-598-P14]|nr:Protein of unknown function DUF262 [Snodgrassella alvi SCGC AB-598-P14]